MYSQSLALELAYIAVEEAVRLGAVFAAGRYEWVSREDLRVHSGDWVRSRVRADRGLGLRVLAHGAWGFAAVAEPNRHDAAVLARRAVSAAQAASVLAEHGDEIVEAEPIRGLHRTQHERDPATVPLNEKVDLLRTVDANLRRSPAVVMARSHLGFERRHSIVVTSEGAEVEQDKLWTSLLIEAGASDGDRLLSLGYPNGRIRAMAAKGWEFIDELDPARRADDLGAAIVEQTRASVAPSGGMSLVLAPAVTAAHLSIMGDVFDMDRPGHGAARSAELGGFVGRRLGPAGMRLSVDSQFPGGAANYAYDDEAIPSEPVTLLEDGCFARGLCSRSGAARAGLERPTASMRAPAWDAPPRVSPSNWVMDGGEAESLEALVADTSHGILVESLSHLESLPDGSFTAVGGRAWLIRDGRPIEPVRDLIYGGHVLEFFTTVDALGPRDAQGTYGYLDDAGLVVGAAVPPLRVRDAQVGDATTGLPAGRFRLPDGLLRSSAPPRRRSWRRTARKDRY